MDKALDLEEVRKKLRLYNGAWKRHTRCQELGKEAGMHANSRAWLGHARWFEERGIYDLFDFDFDPETDSFSLSDDLMQRRF